MRHFQSPEPACSWQSKLENPVCIPACPTRNQGTQFMTPQLPAEKPTGHTQASQLLFIYPNQQMLLFLRQLTLGQHQSPACTAPLAARNAAPHPAVEELPPQGYPGVEDPVPAGPSCALTPGLLQHLFGAFFLHTHTLPHLLPFSRHSNLWDIGHVNLPNPFIPASDLAKPASNLCSHIPATVLRALLSQRFLGSPGAPRPFPLGIFWGLCLKFKGTSTNNPI